jgi:hypothetical protein
MQRLMGLDLVPHIGRSGKDINPCTMPSIKLYKETLSLGDPLTDDELTIFKDQFATLLAGPGSEERKIQLDRIKTYVAGLRAIKHELGDIAFTGLNPEDTELGFGHIRPVLVIMGGGAGVAPLTWSKALTSAESAWLYVSGTTGFTLGNSFGLIITHLMSLVTPAPFMAEATFTAGRTGVMIPVDVRSLRVADNVNGVSVIPVPTIVAKPKSTLYATARSDVTGTDEVAVRGLAVGLGRALKAQGVSYPTA